MVKLSPLTKNDQAVFRLVYKVCYPDGGLAYRDRIYHKKKIATHKAQVALMLEAATARQQFDKRDIMIWQNEGLISPGDAARLGLILKEKTLAELVKDYEETWELSPKEVQARQSRCRKILSVLGEKTIINSLSHQDGIRFRKILLDTHKLSKNSVNKYIQEIKRILDIALANRLIDFNPMARVPNLKIEQHEKFKPTAISSDDVQTLIDKAHQHDISAKSENKPEKIFLNGQLEIFLLFYFGAGIRRWELLKLDWSMVDIKKRIVHLPPEITKAKKGRIIGIGERLWQILSATREKSGPIVQQVHPDTVSHHIKAFFVENGFASLRLHDARHTFSTVLQRSGASKEAAKDRLGHASLEMTAHYTHLEETNSEIEIIEDQLPFMKPDK